MLIDIKSFFLNALINTQSMNILYTPEQDDTASRRPKIDGQNTEQLSPKEGEAMSVKQTFGYREQTGKQGTEDTADTMYGTGTDGIVYMQFLIDELNGEDQYDTTDNTNDNSSCW